MMLKIILFAMLFPTLELYILILIGQRFGAISTVSLVIFTGVIGVFLTKKNGKAVLKELVNTVKQNKVPAKELVEGILILLGGFVLLFPGIISDTLGFLLVLNYSRKLIIHTYWEKIKHSQAFWELKEKLREEFIKKGIIH